MLEFDISVVTLTHPANEPDYTDIQVDLLGGRASCSPGEVHFPYGDWGVPLDPVLDAAGKIDQAQSCQALYAFEGNYLHVWPLEDPRAVKRFPNWKKGDTGKYCGSAAYTRWGVDGTISWSTTDDGTQTGQSVFLTIGPKGLIFQAPWGRLVFDKMGFRVITAGGARFDLGSIIGLPTPLDKLQSFAGIQAQMVDVQGSMVSLGAASPNSQAAALAPPLLLYLTALAKAANQLEAAVDAISKTPATTGSAPAANPAVVTFLTQAKAALAAVLTPPVTISSKTSVT